MLTPEAQPAHRANAGIAVVVVAAGRGSRMGPGDPKQYRMLGPRSVIATAVAGLRQALPGATIQPVIHAEDFLDFSMATAGEHSLAAPVTGAILGWVVLSQALKPLQLFGLAAACASVAFGALAPANPPPTPPRRCTAPTSR